MASIALQGVFFYLGGAGLTSSACFFRTAGDGADLALRLLTESADPIVRPVVERVTRRRLAVLEAAFTELGRPADQARHQASVTYAAYLGMAALRRVDAAPSDGEDYIAAVLVAFGVD
jgi:hypothetical protein